MESYRHGKRQATARNSHHAGDITLTVVHTASKSRDLIQRRDARNLLWAHINTQICSTLELEMRLGWSLDSTGV